MGGADYLREMRTETETTKSPVSVFIERIERLEKRYTGHKHVDSYLIPRELCKQIREELEKVKKGGWLF